MAVEPDQRASSCGPQLENRRVICLPVGADTVGLLGHTLSSLLRNSSPDVEIVVLPLGIEQAQLQAVMRERAEAKPVVLADTVAGDSLWQALLFGIPPAYRNHDLVLVRPGLAVPKGWDDRLALAAYGQEPGIAAVVPLCDSTALFALLEGNDSERTALEAVDNVLLTLGQRHNFEMPALFSGCCYLRRAALRDIEPHWHDMAWEEAPVSLAQRFREQGWHVVCCDHVYVQDRDGQRRRLEMQGVEQLEETHQIEQAHPLTGLRFAVGDILRRGVMKDSTPSMLRPVQLHIAHSWGGGLNRWVQQYCEHDRERDNLVLRSIGTWGAFGQRIALYRSAHMDQPLRYWDLTYPIRATAIAHLKYRMILEEVIADFRIEVILISSLIGHALDALATGLPTIFVAHDYYPFCPAVVIQFGEVCEQCELPRLTRCFAENEQNRFFRNVTAHEWLSLRQRFVDLVNHRQTAFVAPSESVARYWRTLLPAAFDEERFTVIPHGVDFAPDKLPSPPAHDKLRVVILGSLAPQKGRALLETIWPSVMDRVELYLIGCDEDGAIFDGKPGMTVMQRYNHAELANIMADIQPELGVLLSIWPETFSYTLSELWLFGIPVLATAMGSFADRIEEGTNGFLCPPQAEAIADKLRWIAAHRDCLHAPRAWLAHFHHRRIDDMVADYHALTPLPAFAAPRYFAASPALAPLPNANTPARVVYIDVQAPFSQALEEFGHYAGQKLAATPRLRTWQKRWLRAILGYGLRGAKALATLRRRK